MISRTKRLASTLTGLALTAAALAGCTNGADADVEQPTAAAGGDAAMAEAPSASPSPTVDEEEAAVNAAKEALTAYNLMEDEAYHGPESFDISKFENVASGQALVDVQGLLNTWVTEGYRTVGEQTWEVEKVTKVDLTNKPKGDPPKVPTVELKVCTDVSGVDAIDATGESIVPSDRTERQISYISISEADGSWRVADVHYPQETETC